LNCERDLLEALDLLHTLAIDAGLPEDMIATIGGAIQQVDGLIIDHEEEERRN